MTIEKFRRQSFNPATIQVNRGEGYRQLGQAIGQQSQVLSDGVNNYLRREIKELEVKEKELGRKLGKTADIIYEDREFTDELGNKKTHKVAVSYKRPNELLKTSWAASEFDEYAADRYVNQLAINAKQILADEKLLSDERANVDITVAEHVALYNKNINEPLTALLDTVPSEFKALVEDNFNKQLGNKLKVRRLAIGLTQTKVEKAINVRLQQIQKYEKGTNGVSSARLMQISHFLKVPVTYFYEEYRDYKSVGSEEVVSENFNYSFLIKTFNSLSKAEKDKILQSLKNTESLDKTG